MTRSLMTAEDVAKTLGVSKSRSYKIIRELNVELLKNGYRVIPGKVPKKKLEEAFYGVQVS